MLQLIGKKTNDSEDQQYPACGQMNGGPRLTKTQSASYFGGKSMVLLSYNTMYWKFCDYMNGVETIVPSTKE